jgi:hypothetical protein
MRPNLSPRWASEGGHHDEKTSDSVRRNSWRSVFCRSDSRPSRRTGLAKAGTTARHAKQRCCATQGGKRDSTWRPGPASSRAPKRRTFKQGIRRPHAGFNRYVANDAKPPRCAGRQSPCVGYPGCCRERHARGPQSSHGPDDDWGAGDERASGDQQKCQQCVVGRHCASPQVLEAPDHGHAPTVR